MSTVLFLHTPKFNNYYKPVGQFSFINYPPMGLLGLCDCLRKHGHSGKIVHLGVERFKYGKVDVAKLLDENSPSIVGLDLQWHFQSYDVIEIARKLKEAAPSVPVLLGGFTASYFAEEILRTHACIDFIIRGDAEVPLTSLLTHYFSDHDYTSIPNLCYRRGEEIVLNPTSYTTSAADMDDICYTDFELIKDYPEFVQHFARYMDVSGMSQSCQQRLFRWTKTYPILLSRGCIYNCCFCGGSKVSQRVLSNRTTVCVRSVESILKSISDVHKFGFDSICLPQDPFSGAEADSLYVPILDGIKRQQIPVGVEIERYLLPSAAFIESFARLPLRNTSFVTISMHSPDAKLRRRDGLYRFSNEELEESLTRMNDAGVNCLLCFSVGLPFETHDHLRQMAQYRARLRKKFRRHLRFKTCMIEIEPASPMTFHPDGFGIQPRRSSFTDYYRYHSQPSNNHFHALGYERAGYPDQKALSRAVCRQFCERFKCGRASPLVCSVVAALRKVLCLGFLARQKFSSAAYLAAVFLGPYLGMAVADPPYNF